MIIVILKLKNKTTSHDFEKLSDALRFARATPIGTSFQIREGKKLLAKGTIEDYKESNYE